MTIEIQTQDIVHLADSNSAGSRIKAVCGRAICASSILEDSRL